MRKPKKNEIYGIVTKVHAGRRYQVLCKDNKTRLCNVKSDVPKIFLDSIVLLEPWIVQSDTKGRINYRFNKYECSHLRNRIFGDMCV